MIWLDNTIIKGKNNIDNKNNASYMCVLVFVCVGEGGISSTVADVGGKRL